MSSIPPQPETRPLPAANLPRVCSVSNLRTGTAVMAWAHRGETRDPRSSRCPLYFAPCLVASDRAIPGNAFRECDPSMKIKEQTIPFHVASVGEDEASAAADVIRSGWLTMGPKTME